MENLEHVIMEHAERISALEARQAMVMDEIRVSREENHDDHIRIMAILDEVKAGAHFSKGWRVGLRDKMLMGIGGAVVGIATYLWTTSHDWMHGLADVVNMWLGGQ